MKVSILGTDYEIIKKRYDEDTAFARLGINGYCDARLHEIVICDMATYEGWEHETEPFIESTEKATLRHEIVHAFFNESGLQESANTYDGGWSQNEEMVDWFALQGPKIFEAWKAVNAL